ncbi:MAG: hypothetical protein SGI99_17845 [Pseudomonadota bacterium]|nr:hypothetical protein [Pseudomonadota bacterium]
MQSLKTLVTPTVLAAVMGLGFGFGVAQPAHASLASCRAACNAEFRDCRASGDDFFLCRGIWSACLRAC